jgi:hypothetical protein
MYIGFVALKNTYETSLAVSARYHFAGPVDAVMLGARQFTEWLVDSGMPLPGGKYNQSIYSIRRIIMPSQHRFGVDGKSPVFVNLPPGVWHNDAALVRLELRYHVGQHFNLILASRYKAPTTAFEQELPLLYICMRKF